MNKIYILAIIFTLASVSSFAQEKSDDWFGVTGRVRAVDRWEEKPDGPFHTVRGQFRADGWIKINDCVSLNARVTTGQNYNSEWATTGLADGTQSVDVNVRRLYVDVKCASKAWQLQAGAMPVMTQGRLGLTDYGWVDGVRVILNNKNTTASLTMGEVNDLKTPDVFKRKHTGFNYTQAEVIQKFGEGHSVFVNVSEYDDTIYSRAGLKYAMLQYFKWLEYVAAETMFSGKENIGSHFEAVFLKGKWKFIVIYADITSNPTDFDRNNLLVKNFYGYGKNYYFEPSRPIGKTGKWTFGMRMRDGDAGFIVETIFTRTFGKK